MICSIKNYFQCYISRFCQRLHPLGHFIILNRLEVKWSIHNCLLTRRRIVTRIIICGLLSSLSSSRVLIIVTCWKKQMDLHCTILHGHFGFQCILKHVYEIYGIMNRIILCMQCYLNFPVSIKSHHYENINLLKVKAIKSLLVMAIAHPRSFCFT